jgi:hypothetical protein
MTLEPDMSDDLVEALAVLLSRAIVASIRRDGEIESRRDTRPEIPHYKERIESGGVMAAHVD